MKRYGLRWLWVLIIVLVYSCGPKDPQPALPSYLIIPADLSSYSGSGLITVTGEGLSLRAEGPEHIATPTSTYYGVTGNVLQDDINAYFTVGQPRAYRENSSVPAQYRANGWLQIYNTVTPGTYRMGIQEQPGARGEIADLILNLPGPQLYTMQNGSLTISEVTTVKTQGAKLLKRIQGTFAVSATASGLGTTPGKVIPLTGNFDMLFVKD